MSGSQWYFHIDTSIDDGAPGTSHIDQLESDRPSFQSVWRMYFMHNGHIEGEMHVVEAQMQAKYGVNVLFPAFSYSNNL